MRVSSRQAIWGVIFLALLIAAVWLTWATGPALVRADLDTLRHHDSSTTTQP